jgi:hypothetical protein
MPSDTSLIAVPPPFDPAGECPPCCVTGDLSCRRRGDRCAFKHAIESVLVRVRETKMNTSGQTAPRKLAYPSRRRFSYNPCKGVAGLAVLETSRSDYERSLLALFWRASIVSMYGIGP